MSSRHGHSANRVSKRASSMVLALAAIGALALWQLLPTTTAGAPAPVDAKVDVTVGAPSSFADLIEAVKPAVVNISTSATAARFSQDFPDLPPGSPFQDFFERFFGNPPAPGDRGEAPTIQGAGSGFLVAPDGYIVTNNHVVDGAQEIKVILDDGTTHQAKLVGVDPKTDLALIKIETEKDLPYARFGDSDRMRAGDWVIAIGNPFGLGGTATTGIVSARGRDLRAGPFDDFLQIDAPINSGNSGGPLFDTEGRVIGINTAIYSPNGGNIGIGFAIPSKLAEPVIAALRDSGKVERGWLGVEVQGIDEAIAKGLGLEEAQGALVARVVPGSPAEAAGLRSGDVILGVAGEPVRRLQDLTRAVASTPPGEPVALELWRNGKRQSLPVVVGGGETTVASTKEMPKQAEQAAKLGVRLAALDASLRARYRVGNDVEGALITEVAPDTPAARSGLRPGDVIVMVGQKEVSDPETAREALREATSGNRDTVLLQIARGDARRFVPVRFA